MIRKVLFGALILILMAGVALASYAWAKVGTMPQKMWLNEYAVDRDLPNYKVVATIQPDSTLRLKGDKSMDWHMDYLKDHAQYSIWIQVTNLTSQNYGAFKAALAQLVVKYHISADRIILETDCWDVMRVLTVHNFCTAYHMEAPRPTELSTEQVDSVLTRVNRVAESGCVYAISVPGAWYALVHNLYKNSDLDIKYLVRKPTYRQWEIFVTPVGNMMVRDERVRAILVKE